MALRIDRNDVLDATGACIARFGLAKTTLDDVARAAGCSRATVYRFFPGKQQLLGAYVEREAASLGADLVRAAADAPSLADAIAIVMSRAASLLEAQPALTFVATYECDLLLPYLAFARESMLLHAAAALVAPAFERFTDADRGERLGEWVARMTLSYLSCPSDQFDLTDAAQVRAGVVDDFLLPDSSVATLGRPQ
jgi:AcrR family transcriptional regulator